MSLNVYVRQEIRQSIVAVATAMLSAAIAHGGSNVEYCRGILDTSRAQALNYGMPWPEIVADLQSALAIAGRGEVLDFITRTLPDGAR